MSPRSRAVEPGRIRHGRCSCHRGLGGIGHACAERLARDGFDVVSVDVAPPDRPQPGTHVTADLRDIEATVAAVRAACPHVDVLVNGAGVVEPLPFTEVGPRRLGAGRRGQRARAVLPAPGPRRSHAVRRSAVVGIASIEAITVLAMSGATSSIYASTKAALRSLTETLAVELGPRGIRVNAVAPGLIRTPMTARAQIDERDVWIRSHTPLGRWGEPEDIARRRVLPGVARLALHDRRDARGGRRHQPRADPRLGGPA